MSDRIATPTIVTGVGPGDCGADGPCVHFEVPGRDDVEVQVIVSEGGEVLVYIEADDEALVDVALRGLAIGGTVTGL